MEAEARKKNVFMIKISYICLALLTPIALIFCYLFRSDVKDDVVLTSHCNWQIKTGWIALALEIVGYLFIMTVIGAIIGLPLILVVTIWCIYRAIKGFLALEKDAAI